MSSNENENSIVKRFWEGACGIVCVFSVSVCEVFFSGG